MDEKKRFEDFRFIFKNIFYVKNIIGGIIYICQQFQVCAIEKKSIKSCG